MNDKFENDELVNWNFKIYSIFMFQVYELERQIFETSKIATTLN